MGGFLKKITKPFTKMWNDATGHTQRKKAKDSIESAQNAYNEANRLKSEYSASVEPRIREIDNALQAAIHQHHQHDYQLSLYEVNARNMASNINHSENQLQQASHNLQNRAAEYEANLSKHQQEIDAFNKSGVSLQQLVDVFKKDVPELSSKIEEYKQMPEEFFSQIAVQKAKKSMLAGFSREEKGEEIAEYELGVEALKQKRSELEAAITAEYKGLSKEHQSLVGRQKDLISRLGVYNKEQDRLLARSEHYKRQRTDLENLIAGYKAEESRHLSEITRAQQLKAEYDAKHQQYLASGSNISKLVQDAVHYQNVTADYQNRIEQQVGEAEKHQGWAADHAKKARIAARRFVMGSMALGGLTAGLGYLGSIGTAASATTPAITGTGLMGFAGITSTLGAISLGAGLGGLAGLAFAQNTLKKLPSINVPDSHIDPEFSHNLQNAISGDIGNASYLGKNAPISSGMLGNSPAINIPQLGGWQNPKHFGVSQMPELHELPNLETALGRLRDPKELSELTLGLAKSSNKEGKTYNYGVLLDPFFNKHFKKVMKKAQKYGSYSYNNPSAGVL